MTTRRTRLTAALVAAPLAFTLVACGDDDADTGSRSDDAPASSSPSPADDADDAPGAGQASAPAAPVGDTAGLLAAATTALGEVPGATVFSVDAEPTGWEVTLVAADGTESEVAIGPDGAVARGPVTDTDEADDLAERRRLLSEATVDHAAAVAAAEVSSPGAVVTGVDLDLDAGRATWDVQLGEDTPEEQTVTVDARTGEVIGTERDD
jgi:uncharacterized membrane protein YkoI